MSSRIALISGSMLARDFTKGDVLTFRSSALKMSSSGIKAMRLAFTMVLPCCLFVVVSLFILQVWISN